MALKRDVVMMDDFIYAEPQPLIESCDFTAQDGGVP